MGRFHIVKSASSFSFLLKDKDQLIVQGCIQYNECSACIDAIKKFFTHNFDFSLRDKTSTVDCLCPNPKFEISQNKSGHYYFTISAEDGSEFAQSISFPTKLDCINSIDFVMKCCVQP